MSEATGRVPTVRTFNEQTAEPGSSLVVVHGTMDRSASFRPLVRQARSWRITAYDRRGWGLSRELGDEKTRLEDHVHDLVRIAEVEASPVVLGHSYGGIVALCAAARHPALFSGVIVYEPPIRWLPWWPDEAPWEKAALDELSHGYAAVAAAMQEAVTGQPPGPERRRNNELEQDGRALITELRDPSLEDVYFSVSELADQHVVVAAGDASLPHHQEVSRRLAQLLDCASYFLLPDADHLAHVTAPAMLAALLDHLAARRKE